MIERSEQARQTMVSSQLERRGIRCQAVLDAMARVPRELFIPERLAASAYEDGPLPIAAGQTISQPYIVAYMIEALQLRGGEKVLEIGAGSGYAAAVLAQIAGQVYSIERVPELAASARDSLRRAGCDNVQIIEGDGTLGYPPEAPYDAIVVTAGGPRVPSSLSAQLDSGGRLVMPVGPRHSQELLRMTRVSAQELRTEQLLGVRFVPLLGEEGWSEC